MLRAQKFAVVNTMQEVLAHPTVFVTRHQRLTVAEVTQMRVKFREIEAGLMFTKNSLAKIAVANSNNATLSTLFLGQTAVVYSKDPVSLAKLLMQFSKEHEEKFAVVGGVSDGALMDQAAIRLLATLPSLDQLRGKLIGLISAPAQKIVGILQAPAGQIARVLSAHATK